MEQRTQVSASGSYSASLLGTIRSHLEGLQGYDVMALELIQNADDAKAEEIVFDITDRGLFVTNTAEFTYCGDLTTRPCPLSQNNKYGCDYHRITEVASGGKLSRGENIGRFGIGFVSTYQITNHPEIRSAGISLTLHPESGEWIVRPSNQAKGTSFFLPWATDPNAEARLALGVSHVGPEHIEQLVVDFLAVIRKSLLFLRHVRKAEVRRDGKLLLACDLDRGTDNELIVGFRPSGTPEQWHILRADASAAAEQLYKTHPRLQGLNRDTIVSIGLRIGPEPLTDGYLYAFLPTEHSTGMPLHINADFFPEADRKGLIFTGHQHQQAWNEMLIDAAATELARDPEILMKTLGHTQMWQIFSRAYELSKPQNHPACFAKFWERIKATGTRSRIALAQDGSIQPPNGVIYADAVLDKAQVKGLQEIGGRSVVDDLRTHRNALIQLGTPILTLDRLTNLMAQAFAGQTGGETEISRERRETLYRPLWSIANDLLPETGTQGGATNPAIQKLLTVPFLVTEDEYLVTASQSYIASSPLNPEKVAALLPRLAILSKDTFGYPRIARLVKPLSLGVVAGHLKSMITSAESIDGVIGTAKKELRDLYSLFAELDRLGKPDNAVYVTLRDLPIWLSSKGLVSANHMLLPGAFTDPTGLADLLNPTVLTDNAREFVSTKIGVPSQTIEAFVTTVLPRFFGNEGPIDPTKYQTLVTELADHPSLINDENIRRLLASMPLIPTQDGKWATPGNTYRRTKELARVLGDASHLWIDQTRIPRSRSVTSFLDSLGIRRSPIAQHLVDRMLYIAERYTPSDEARRASGDAFYVLCDNFEEWKDKKAFQDAINRLQDIKCFPADGDDKQWYCADDLYAPFRSEAFSTQAYVLDFTANRLKSELLVELGIEVKPATELVIDHLLHCSEHNIDPHVLTYQVLNERARDKDTAIDRLKGARCIYVENQKQFVRPNQLYWTPQQLGRFAFTIPGNLELYKPFFGAIGVKNSPEATDYVDFVLDIVGEYFEQGKPLEGADRSVYEACFTGLASLDDGGQILSADLNRLQTAPTIINLLHQLTHPDEVLLQDSEWHATFFNGELNRALCKPVPELWSLLENIGVKRLSECADVALEFVDGEQQSEPLVAQQVREREQIVARLLHDKLTLVRNKVSQAFAEVKAFSYDVVRIQATVHLGEDNEVAASPSPAQAFYEIDRQHLILARPVGERSFPHILNALFHQLMPEESGIEISKLTLSLRPLMSMPVEQAHRELSDAGIPFLHAEQPGEPEDLTSPELNDIGGSTESADASTDAISEPEDKPITAPGSVEKVSGGTPEIKQSPEPAKPQQTMGAPVPPANLPTGGRPTATTGIDKANRSQAGGHKRSRSKHKEQWDRRLLSYVRQKAEKSDDADGTENMSDHNLSVEVIARDATCAYERERGRLAKQMAQTHPGYDIISSDPLTGEQRFIEVKGVNGEWNQMGVGLSSLQFSNAQNYGDAYWLYVVEFVSDPQHIRVHPIRSPATKVTAFMFDGNWRDVAEDERADPAAAFVPGARVKHQSYGLGRIATMELRGLTRLMQIDFDKPGRRLVTLNLQTMAVIEDDHGDDAP